MQSNRNYPKGDKERKKNKILILTHQWAME